MRLAKALLISSGVLCFEGPVAAREAFTQAQYDMICGAALQGFWGRALLSNGRTVQPASAAERETVPVSDFQARQVIFASIPAGMALWCGVDHRPYYQNYMTYERQKGHWTDKQLAFIGVLFGTAQGVIKASFGKQTCDGGTRAKVIQTMDANSADFRKEARR